MSPSSNNQIPRREDNEGWELKSSSDNGVDLLSYAVKADGILDAARLSEPIVALIAPRTKEDSGWASVTLRSWYIEIVMSAPEGAWFSEAQRQLATSIVSVTRTMTGDPQHKE